MTQYHVKLLLYIFTHHFIQHQFYCYHILQRTKSDSILFLHLSPIYKILLLFWETLNLCRYLVRTRGYFFFAVLRFEHPNQSKFYIQVVQNKTIYNKPRLFHKKIAFCTICTFGTGKFGLSPNTSPCSLRMPSCSSFQTLKFLFLMNTIIFPFHPRDPSLSAQPISARKAQSTKKKPTYLCAPREFLNKCVCHV